MLKFSCKVPILSIRKSPDETSEMISQMLYGETCTITEKQGDYANITTDFDGVSGWVFALSLEETPMREKSILEHSFVNLTLHNEKMLVSLGSEIQMNTPKNHQNITPEHITELAQKFLNTPYLYGGRSIFGIDSSAFAQLVYKVARIPLPRFSAEQAELGTTLDFVEESLGGELAFFDNENGNINHTGIMLNNYEILHCFGKIRKDSIDSSGIFNVELNKHTHKLRFIKRILE